MLQLAVSSKWGEQISFGDLITLTNDRKGPAAVEEKENFILHPEFLEDIVSHRVILVGFLHAGK